DEGRGLGDEAHADRRPHAEGHDHGVRGGPAQGVPAEACGRSVDDGEEVHDEPHGPSCRDDTRPVEGREGPLPRARTEDGDAQGGLVEDEDGDVPPLTRQARVAASTSSSIAGVSSPVYVLRAETWKQPWTRSVRPSSCVRSSVA